MSAFMDGRPADEKEQVAKLAEQLKGTSAEGWIIGDFILRSLSVPLVMFCPNGHRHVDQGEWATKPHKTHQCQHIVRTVDLGEGPEPVRCGNEWRPADFPTVGI